MDTSRVTTEYFQTLNAVHQLHKLTTWTPSSVKVGDQFDEVIDEHMRTFPVHPLCIRRVYWMLELLRPEHSDMPVLQTKTYTILPFVRWDEQDNVFFEDPNKGHGDASLYKTLQLGTVPDNVVEKLAFNFPRHADLFNQDDCEVIPMRKLYVQEYLPILLEYDWTSVVSDPRVEKVELTEGLTVLDIVQPLARWYNTKKGWDLAPSSWAYSPLPQYPWY